VAGELDGLRIAFLATDGVEQVELTEPWRAVEQAGGHPVLVSPKDEKVQGFEHLDKGDVFDVDETVDRTAPESFDALVIPGGVANPDAMRMDGRCVRFVKSFFDRGRPAAVICHGPWMLAEADVARGRTLTSWPSLQTDLRNAGATWVDDEVVICPGGSNVLVTSRKPDDLPKFCEALVGEFHRASQKAGSSSS
jgi:protease I